MKLSHFTIIVAIAAALAGCGHKDSPGERAGGTPPGDNIPAPPVEPAGTVAFAVKEAGLAMTEVTAQIPAGGAEIMYFSLSAVDGQPATATLSASAVLVGPSGTATVKVSEQGAIGRTYTLSASTVAPVFPGPLAAISDFLASPAHAAGAFAGNVVLTTSVSRWSQSLAPTAGRKYIMQVAPAVTGTGLACFAGAEQDAGWANYLTLSCNDTATGNPVWSITPDATRAPASYHALAADTSGIYLGLAGGKVEGRSLATGVVLWSANVGGEVYSVAAGLDKVYAGGMGWVRKLDRATGATLWQANLPAVAGYFSPAFYAMSATADSVYAVGVTSSAVNGDYALILARLDAATGAVVWQQVYSPGPTSIMAPTVSANSEGVYAVFGPRNGATTLAKYSLADGSFLWNKTIGTASGAVFATDLGIFASSGNMLMKFDYDGLVVWSATPPGLPTAATWLAMSGANIYYAATNPAGTATIGRLDDL